LATTLDTLAIAKDLRESDFTEKQAEALARVLRTSREADLSELATKADIALLRSDMNALRTDMNALRAELKSDIAGTRSDLEKQITELRGDMKVLRWMIGAVLALVTAAVVRLLFPGVPLS
jgi:hypothetical protein